MALNPELALWRTVLFLALRDKDAAAWLASPDGEIVCALAGVEPLAVARAFDPSGPRRRIKRGVDRS
ncbi:hypothetical protein [Rhodovulum sp.]|uniref:hypothetical protein n=1 Tax=Rhodovulum sp. TaxID=34009 RepID=UPI0017F3A9EE|nr:hypothetical protein [Rhodovulum sp.]HDR28852.1 hypothetical protein [Rhodovulum sp.]